MRSQAYMLIRIPKSVKPKDVRRLRSRVQQYVNAVLKNDGEGDYSWLLELMRYKISRMRKATLGSHVEDAKRIGKQMMIVEEALKRLRDDEYHYNRTTELGKKNNIKLGFVKRKNDKACALECLPIDKSKPMNEKAYRRGFIQAYKEAEKEASTDLKLAFETMRDHIRTWWD